MRAPADERSNPLTYSWPSSHQLLTTLVCPPLRILVGKHWCPNRSQPFCSVTTLFAASKQQHTIFAHLSEEITMASTTRQTFQRPHSQHLPTPTQTPAPTHAHAHAQSRQRPSQQQYDTTDEKVSQQSQRQQRQRRQHRRQQRQRTSMSFENPPLVAVGRRPTNGPTHPPTHASTPQMNE